MGLMFGVFFGDHLYKPNSSLPPKGHMIIAWPDVIVEQLRPNKDEFMVLICDGIWNCISNEELISFVAKQLKQLTNYRKYANNYSLDYCRQSCLRRESLVKTTSLI
jgi:serine/threonine protein phosphatase PrpC